MSKAEEANAPPGYPGGAPPGYGSQPAPYGAPPPQGYAQGYAQGYPPPGQPQGYNPAQPAYPQGGVPPPPPGYVTPGTTVVVSQPGRGMATVVAPPAFRETPVTMNCPHCQAHITTSTHYQAGTMTWIVCGGICLAGLAIPLVWLGCCFIPFCVNSLKDVIHECPNCSREVGRFDRTR